MKYKINIWQNNYHEIDEYNGYWKYQLTKTIIAECNTKAEAIKEMLKMVKKVYPERVWDSNDAYMEIEFENNTKRKFPIKDKILNIKELYSINFFKELNEFNCIKGFSFEDDFNYEARPIIAYDYITYKIDERQKLIDCIATYKFGQYKVTISTNKNRMNIFDRYAKQGYTTEISDEAIEQLKYIARYNLAERG